MRLLCLPVSPSSIALIQNICSPTPNLSSKTGPEEPGEPLEALIKVSPVP